MNSGMRDTGAAQRRRSLPPGGHGTNFLTLSPADRAVRAA